MQLLVRGPLFKFNLHSISNYNPRAILHDEKAYPDPFLFNPERFLKDGKLDSTVQDPGVAIFGYGRRMWYVGYKITRVFRPVNLTRQLSPGRHMALESIWLTAASVLASFDINKAIGPDGVVIEPSGKYSSGLAW